ncbi:MAG: methylmalonyl-CoA epimerase [Ignavibacteriales bacterium CG12_big_fil_rev_8_21_14_0_65_30_8]|nr:MAG: methylmalonyl-CoA epimerase [Ignavibacteriales bacterium CG12_big_fil_rev_8_21_14_0_65_30_8]
MKIKKIEHIGIAVKDLKKTIEFYESVLGLKCYKIEEVKDQKVKTAFLKVGETKIELLETTDNDGPIGKFIEKKGEGLHHIAYSVEGLNSSLNEISNQQIKLIDEKPKQGADNLDIAFIHPKSANGVLIELCEERK